MKNLSFIPIDLPEDKMGLILEEENGWTIVRDIDKNITNEIKRLMMEREKGIDISDLSLSQKNKGIFLEQIGRKNELRFKIKSAEIIPIEQKKIPFGSKILGTMVTAAGVVLMILYGCGTGDMPNARIGSDDNDTEIASSNTAELGNLGSVEQSARPDFKTVAKISHLPSSNEALADTIDPPSDRQQPPEEGVLSPCQIIISQVLLNMGTVELFDQGTDEKIGDVGFSDQNNETILYLNIERNKFYGYIFVPKDKDGKEYENADGIRLEYKVELFTVRPILTTGHKGQRLWGWIGVDHDDNSSAPELPSSGEVNVDFVNTNEQHLTGHGLLTSKIFENKNPESIQVSSEDQNTFFQIIKNGNVDDPTSSQATLDPGDSVLIYSSDNNASSSMVNVASL